MKLKLDLHEIFSDGERIEQALADALSEAKLKKAKSLEIIPGKGSGQLKKRVIKLLTEKYKDCYHRLEKDDKNWGRIFLHFRW